MLKLLHPPLSKLLKYYEATSLWGWPSLILYSVIIVQEVVRVGYAVFTGLTMSCYPLRRSFLPACIFAVLER